MLILNLKSRFRNKAFILAMVGAVVLLIQQMGFAFIPANYSDIVNTILTILTMLGIVVDTSTKGLSDQVTGSTTSVNNVISTTSQVSTTNEPVINAVTINGPQ